MHHAPAVSYPVGRSRFHGVLLAAVVLSGAVSLWAWGAHAAVAPGWLLAGWGFWLFASGLGVWQWWRTPAGLLSWDAQAWVWTSPVPSRAPVALQLRAVADLQGVLLLQAQSADAVAPLPHALRWLWAERRSAPPRWLALRRAVFAAPTLAAQADAGGPQK